MDISIIIVNWNTMDMLLNCLRAIDAQSGAFEKETVVVDNGSTDGSQEAVRKEFPGVLLIENNANLGFAKANNIGIAKSSGRYVCLVNSDAMLMEDCLQRLLAYMDENPGTGVSGPRILNPDLSLQSSCRKFPSLWNNMSSAIGLHKIFRGSPGFSGEEMFYFGHDRTMDVDWLCGCVLFVRRRALMEVGLLDEQFFIYQEEVDWCKRFRQSGWKVTFFPEAVAVHHIGASSSKDPMRFLLLRQKAFMLYWEKHHSATGVMSIRLILLLRHTLRIIARSVLYCVRGPGSRMQGRLIRADIACASALLRPDDRPGRREG